MTSAQAERNQSPQSNDRPGTRDEKFRMFLQRHIDFGIGFDEAAICRTLGMPVPEHPRLYERDTAIAQHDRTDEIRYQAEVQAKADAAARRDLQVEDLRLELEAARREIARLGGVVPAATTLARTAVPKVSAVVGDETEGDELSEAPEDEPGATQVIGPSSTGLHVPPPAGGPQDGLPTPEWNLQRQKRWLETEGLPLPPRAGVGLTLTQFAEHCRKAHAEKHQAAA